MTTKLVTGEGNLNGASTVSASIQQVISDGNQNLTVK
jgi:hypothetical protein